MSNGRKHGSRSDHVQHVVMNLYQSWGKGTGKSNATSTAEKHRRVATLEPFVHLQIKIYLDEWKEQVNAAITDAQMPVEPQSRAYWFIALAGNLLWAATCFVPTGGPLRLAVSGVASATEKGAMELGLSAAASVEASATGQRVIQVMSVAGATIGSGTVEQLAGSTGNPEQDGKRVIRVIIGKKRADLEDVFKPRSSQWASEIDALAQWGDDVKELMDKYLWIKMFPRIPYDRDRFVTIYKLALSNVSRVLADYNAQWKDWSFRKERSQPQWKHRRMYGEDWDYSVPDPGPFQPKLKFDN